MDPGAPQSEVRDADLSNELANLQWDFRPTVVGSGFPAPIGSKARAVPADHRSVKCGGHPMPNAFAGYPAPFIFDQPDGTKTQQLIWGDCQPAK